MSAEPVMTDRSVERDDELQDARAILEHLVMWGPVVMFRRKATDNLVTYVSPNIERVLGYSVDEVRGVPNFWPEHVHPDDRPRFTAEMDQAMKDGTRELERDYRFQHKDGEYRWLHAVARFDYDPEGSPQGLLGYGIDVTDRKRVEEERRESEERLARILETEASGIVIVNREGHITFANAAAERSLRLSRDEIANRTYNDPQWRITTLGGEPFLDEQNPVSLVMQTGRPVRDIELAIEPHGGERVFLSVSAAPLHDASGSLAGVVASFDDITDRKRAEEAVLRAKEEAEQADRAKSEFLSRMSHELRTPLNAVLGFGQLLEMDELSSEQRESTQHILKAGRHLLALINEVLDISRIESGSLGLSIEPVAVRDLVGEALDLVRPMAAAREIALTVEESDGLDQHVLADRQRLKQVILNLLSNAVKYNHERGTATLSSRPSSEGRLRVEVADTGPGIDPERVHELFTPFQRLGAEQTDVEGTGLGLALSKRLVEAMGGTIGVQSSPGHGATFFVELPLTEGIVPGEMDGEVVPSAARVAAPRTLVYIEDNLDNLRLVERILDRWEALTIIPALQAAVGLDLVRDQRPDLVLLDLNLPDMPGADVLHRLKQDPSTRDIPVVVISADATPGQIRRLMAAGARDYITKPIEVSRFVEVVSECLDGGGDGDA